MMNDVGEETREESKPEDGLKKELDRNFVTYLQAAFPQRYIFRLHHLHPPRFSLLGIRFFSLHVDWVYNYILKEQNTLVSFRIKRLFLYYIFVSICLCE